MFPYTGRCQMRNDTKQPLASYDENDNYDD